MAAGSGVLLPGEGKHTALFIVNFDEPSQLPSLVELFFTGLNAEVEVTPAMTLEEKKGLGAIEKELKR